MSEISSQFIYTEELYKLPGKVIVLLPVSWETLPEDEVILLGKILGSVRLSLAGVQVLCCEKADVHELDVFNPSVIISFGTMLNPKIESYTQGEVDGIRIIQSDALTKLDDTKKKSLWNVLKLAFA
jgi:hypothetical protein